ncbi:phage antirepressor N-terminal domain-containing protein [Methylomonas rapida]|uniref:BRO family protein n=1 Tax=Methylomonas rapida TaxID=2963939 RepID=A0ABY7GGK6_9GAMM|nr:phage antirepressor N-terminal domain-containing protein [Methylomonas rapida]WAR42918.1 BRO family protein [Methylomonas rapida]
MTTQALTIPFHDQSLVAALINDMPHVALKPICDNLGIDWTAQFRRIKRNEFLNSTVAMMAIVAEDGKLREMLMMPIKYLNGWLFGVDASRVKPEIKPRLLDYQRECFKVLATHFMPSLRNGLVEMPNSQPQANSQPNTPIKLQFHNHSVRLVADENGEPWFMANDVCNVLGYASVAKALKDHCRSQGVTHRYPVTLEIGPRYPSFISLGNLYRMIIKSRRADAESFETWILAEALPKLRPANPGAPRLPAASSYGVTLGFAPLDDG